jgi:hypothetical protein
MWLTVTFLTRPTKQENLKEFYRRVRPGGPGWRHIERELGLEPQSLARDLVGALGGAVFIYSSLFTLGKALLGFSMAEWLPFGVIAVISGAVTVACLRE